MQRLARRGISCKVATRDRIGRWLVAQTIPLAAVDQRAHMHLPGTFIRPQLGTRTLRMVQAVPAMACYTWVYTKLVSLERNSTLVVHRLHSLSALHARR